MTRFWNKTEASALTLVRISLGVIFVWFGLLKITGDSPADHMVAATLPALDPAWLVPAVGGVEIVIGAGFLIAPLLPWIFPLFLAQQAGTFLLLFVSPGLCFQGRNPLLLTEEGEFVVKNLVLVFAALAVYAARRKSAPVPRP